MPNNKLRCFEHPCLEENEADGGISNEEAEELLDKVVFTKPLGFKKKGEKEGLSKRTGIERVAENLLYKLLKSFISGGISKNYYACAGKGRHFAVKDLEIALPKYRFVYKTDVKSYYASINLFLLFDLLSKFTLTKWLTNALTRFLYSGTSDEKDWHYRPRGICGIIKGSPVSVLIAELYLRDLDEKFTRVEGIYYQRYVDDIIILARSRKTLRNGIRLIKQGLHEKALGVRYGQTYVGKTTDLITYLGFKIKRMSNGMCIRGITRESKKRSRKRSVERTLEVDKMTRAIEARALLCFAQVINRQNVVWYKLRVEEGGWQERRGVREEYVRVMKDRRRVREMWVR